MDLKQLEYMTAIQEWGSITHAAQKLFITQSALNQQLLKLESQLGVSLFYRSRTSCIPTKAGEIYLDGARRMLAMKKDIYNRIYDAANAEKGTLSIGFTPNRGSVMFSAIYPRFHEKYGDILVEPLELSVAKQLEMLEKGNLDIGFLTLRKGQRKPGFSYIDIKQEEIFLAVPKSRSLDCASPAPLSRVKEEPFVLMYRESSIRTLIDALFEDAGFEPNILFETSGTNTILHMIEAGICCGLIPEYYVNPKSGKISFYSLPSRPTWDIAACYNKNHYLSQAAEGFIELAGEYWK